MVHVQFLLTCSGVLCIVHDITALKAGFAGERWRVGCEFQRLPGFCGYLGLRGKRDAPNHWCCHLRSHHKPVVTAFTVVIPEQHPGFDPMWFSKSILPTEALKNVGHSAFSFRLSCFPSLAGISFRFHLDWRLAQHFQWMFPLKGLDLRIVTPGLWIRNPSLFTAQKGVSRCVCVSACFKSWCAFLEFNVGRIMNSSITTASEGAANLQECKQQIEESMQIMDQSWPQHFGEGWPSAWKPSWLTTYNSPVFIYMFLCPPYPTVALSLSRNAEDRDRRQAESFWTWQLERQHTGAAKLHRSTWHCICSTDSGGALWVCIRCSLQHCGLWCAHALRPSAGIAQLEASKRQWKQLTKWTN